MRINYPITAALSLVLLGASAGCSKVGQAPSSASPAQTAMPAALPVGNACDRKLITPDDVAGLVSEPISSVEPLKGDPQSCIFNTAGSTTVDVALRPGLGDVTVSETLAGKTNVDATAVAGVGDRAAWTSILKEINATKNNTLCDISVTGPASGPATQEKVAALCNKIFAAL
jgi:hypothetical protein